MDIFGKKRKENESILKALDLSQAVIHFLPDGTILWANQNFLSAMGYSLDEIKGKHHSIFVQSTEHDTPAYRKFWADLNRGTFSTGEYKRIAKGGKEIWIQGSYNPILDNSGKPYKIVKFATDITENVLKNADYVGQINAMRKSQAVIHFTLNGEIIDANDNFLSALGYKIDEIKGKHHQIFVERTYAQSTEYKQFWSALNRGEYQSGEYKRIGKDGREVWIQATYNPILDPEGRPFKVVKFATDITADVLKRHKKEAIGQLVDKNLGNIVDSVTNASKQTTSAASASSQTAATVNTIASAAEELNSSIQEIAESMTRSKNSVDQTILLANNADQLTHKLSNNANKMNGIVELIQDIASQINLLALNATIEAARAGETGKGFAVVASEVKNLATQVAQATDKIAIEIDEMQSASIDVVECLNNIKVSIGAIEAGVTGVAGAIEEQSAVSKEISSHMQTASVACGDVDSSLKEILSSMTLSNQYTCEVQKMSKELVLN